MPQLRPGLEVTPLPEQNNQTIWGLRDTWQINSNIIAFSEDMLYILQFFDGRHTAQDIRHEYLKAFNSFLLPEQFAELVEILDENYFLQNDRFVERMQEICDAYRRLSSRPAQHAGKSYPSHSPALKQEFDAYDRQVQQSHALVNRILARRITGLVVPHIDIRLAGSSYAHAYRYLAQSRPADLYVILGIGHQGLMTAFAPTRLDFDTPLGVVQTDRALLAEIDRRTVSDFSHQEFFHLQEHSIEFQAVYLRYALQHDFKILPILCSFPHTIFSASGNDTGQHVLYQEFLSALKSVLSSYPARVCLIASVDLAHVGRLYGDDWSPSARDLACVEQYDRKIIDCIKMRDAAALQRHIDESDNVYHICGYSALMPFIELLPPSRGDLLDYRQAQMDEQRSTVSFCSMIFS